MTTASLLRLARPAVSITAVATVAWWGSRQPLPHIPTDARALSLVALALAVYTVGTALRAERWRLLMRRRLIPVRRTDAYGLTTVGYMGNNVLPARAGDLLRVYLLEGRTRMSRREGYGTALAERLVDAGALAIVFGVATATLVAERRTPHSHPVLIVLAVLAAALAVGAAVLAGVMHPRRGSARARALLGPFLASSRDLVGGFGVGLLGLSLLVWTAEALVYWILAVALHLPIGLVAAIYVMAFANFAGLVPAGPGYVGTYDAAVLLAAAAFGVHGALAVAYLALLRFALFVPITLAGLVLLAVRYSGLSAIRRIGLARGGSRSPA